MEAKSLPCIACKLIKVANKVSIEHIFFHKKKMKVYLATQLLSNSVADAIEFCNKDLKLSEFSDSEATCQFLRVFNRIFDILDSTQPFCLKKPALKVSNKDIWTKDFDDTVEYIRSLYMMDPTKEPETKRKKPISQRVIDGQRRRGFLGFIVDIMSFKFIFSTYIEETLQLDFLLGHKFSQDHLERTNGAVRSSLGSNNNPTVRQFKAAMKKILLGATHHGVAENCQVQDDTAITTPTFTADSNKLFSELFDLDDDKSAVEIYLQSLECNIEKSDFEYRDAILNYISGFIQKKLIKKERCVDCALYLENIPASNLKEGGLIKVKNRGGLVLPSVEIEKVVNIADALYSEINTDKLFGQKNIVKKIQIETCKVVAETHPHLLEVLDEHMGTLGSHKFLMIKNIVGCYISMRGRRSAKMLNENSPKIRMQMTKLILFKNQ